MRTSISQKHDKNKISRRRWNNNNSNPSSAMRTKGDNIMPFQGAKTKEVVEQQMFSVLNMIIKRNYYTEDMQKIFTQQLKILSKEYLTFTQ